MIYLVFGGQSPIIAKRIRKLAEASLNGPLDSMNYVKYSANDVTIAELVDEARLLPLGYERKVIVYESCPLFLKESKKQNEDDEKLLTSYIQDQNSDVDLFFACYEEVNKNSKLYSLIYKVGKIIEIAEIKKNEWVEYVRRYCVDVLKMNIDKNAIYELANRTKNDAASLINNADKLSNYTDRIHIDDVDLLVTRPLEDNIFRIFDALSNRRNMDAIKIFRDLLEQNIVVNNVITILGNQFRLLGEVSYLIRNNKNDTEIMEQLKIKDWQLKDMRHKAMVINKETIIETLDQLYELDRQIKSGIIAYDYRNLVFELFLINFKII